MLKMLLLVICEVPKKISTIFKPFLAIFTLFHLKNWPYLPKPEFGNLAKTRFWLLLVNNSLCSIPRSGARSEIKKNAGDRCALEHSNIDNRIFLQGWCRVKVVFPYEWRRDVFSVFSIALLYSDVWLQNILQSSPSPWHYDQQPAPCSTRDNQIADTEPSVFSIKYPGKYARH